MAPEIDTIYRWCKSFNPDQFIILGNRIPGRPMLKGLEEPIKRHLKLHPLSSTRQIAKGCNHSTRAVKRRLITTLDMKYTIVKRVPHNLDPKKIPERQHLAAELRKKIREARKKQLSLSRDRGRELVIL
jgi:hypothetical protein